MFKKFTIASLILTLIGTAAIWQVLSKKRQEQRHIDSCKAEYAYDFNDYFEQYNQWMQLGPEKQGTLPWDLDKDGKPMEHEQLTQQQHDRFLADLDGLIVGEMEDCPFADALYGPDWQQQLQQHKNSQETRELVFTAWIVCAAVGGAVFACCALLFGARLVIKTAFATKNLSTHLLGMLGKNRKRNIAGHSKKQVLEDCGWQNFKHVTEEEGVDYETSQAGSEHQDADPKSQKALALTNRTKWYRKDNKSSDKQSRPAQSEQDNSSGADTKESTASEDKPATTQAVKEKNSKAAEPATTVFEKTNILKSRDYPLKQQQTKTEKKPSQDIIENAEPLRDSLAELTQQVSAIREYTSSQQQNIKRLQDGYDWNIIKNFCLRIIRCIDNLENRIEELLREAADTTCLEHVRDELVFALESSGIEQFEPEVNGEYHGQEKTAEVVKKRQLCDEPDMEGKIADVIRPGYQYFIDDENTRIVRAAQVKLFSRVCN